MVKRTESADAPWKLNLSSVNRGFSPAAVGTRSGDLALGASVAESMKVIYSGVKKKLG
jgi:hypothetical protein